MSTATETTTAPAPAPSRRTGRIIAAALAAAAVIALAVLAFLAAGQSSQIGALNARVGQLAGQAQAAQSQAAAAKAAATAAGSTRSAADNANLGVCVSTNYSYSSVTYVSGVSITSPQVSAGGAVSCPAGTFTPVSPQKA
jgi:type VI protein secretion system component VasK